MAKVVIAAWGSRGDVAPLTDVGLRLQEAGHDVALTAPSGFGLTDLVTACGLRAIPVHFEIAGIVQLLSPKGIRSMGEALLGALVDEPADVLLLSPFCELAGHPLAEARDIPSIGVRMQPLTATKEYPPALLGAWSAGPLLNRAAGGFATAAIDRIYAQPVASFRKQLGLARVAARTLHRRRTEAAWPILHGYSPAVVPRPSDWRRGLDVVGYWWSQPPVSWDPPEEVVTFLESGPPPVFIGFGSLMLSEKDRVRLAALVPEALRLARVRGIVQAGWAGLDVRSDDVLTIGEVPYDWLFNRVAAVVHSCGAGTVASGLRAGVPTVAIPEPGADKMFWAKRLNDLGASAATLSRRKLTAERLAAAVAAAVSDPTYRDNAKRIASLIATEVGAQKAVGAVERLLR